MLVDYASNVWSAASWTSWWRGRITSLTRSWLWGSWSHLGLSCRWNHLIWEAVYILVAMAHIVAKARTTLGEEKRVYGSRSSISYSSPFNVDLDALALYGIFLAILASISYFNFTLWTDDLGTGKSSATTTYLSPVSKYITINRHLVIYEWYKIHSIIHEKLEASDEKMSMMTRRWCSTQMYTICNVMARSEKSGGLQHEKARFKTWSRISLFQNPHSKIFRIIAWPPLFSYPPIIFNPSFLYRQLWCRKWCGLLYSYLTSHTLLPWNTLTHDLAFFSTSLPLHVAFQPYLLTRPYGSHPPEIDCLAKTLRRTWYLYRSWR